MNLFWKNKNKNTWVKCLPFDPITQNYSALQFKEIYVQYFDLMTGDATWKANEASGNEIMDRNVETLCQVWVEMQHTSHQQSNTSCLWIKRHQSCWEMYIQVFQKLYQCTPTRNTSPGTFHIGPVAEPTLSALPLQGVQVWSLVGEPRSHMLCSTVKNKMKKWIAPLRIRCLESNLKKKETDKWHI